MLAGVELMSKPFVFQDDDKTNTEDMLTIGEMAKLCRVPIKTLRYFDKTGTAKPAYVDPSTQYRYYSKNQLPYIVILKEMRAKGFSLADIRKFSKIVELDETVVFIDEKLGRIDRQIEKLLQVKQQCVSWKDYLRPLYHLQYDHITVKHIPARTVVFVRYRSKCDAYSVNVRVAEHTHIIHDHNLYQKGPLMAVFHDDLRFFNPEDADIEVCWEVSTDPGPHSFVREIPDGLYASVIHRGKPETLMPEVYPGLYSWIKENNYQVTGPLIQVYLWYAPMGQIPENVIYEIQVPVKK